MDLMRTENKKVKKKKKKKKKKRESYIFNFEKCSTNRLFSVFLWEAQCTRSWSERSGFESWPGTLCCVLGQDTQLSQCLSPPRSINGYRRIVGET